MADFTCVKSFRGFLALVILVAGIVFSVWNVGKNSFETTPRALQRENNSITSQRENDPTALKGSVQSGLTPLKNIKGGDDNSSSTLPRNLTDSLIKAYAEKNLENRTYMTKDLTKISSLSETMIDSVIKENVKNGFDFNLFSKKDLRITSVSTPESETAYLESIILVRKKIIKNTDLFSGIKKYFDDGNENDLKKFTQAVPLLIAELLALEAPISFESFHLRLVNLWRKQLEIGQAVMELKDDPLRTLLALQESNKVLKEMNELQDDAKFYYASLIQQKNG